MSIPCLSCFEHLYIKKNLRLACSLCPHINFIGIKFGALSYFDAGEASREQKKKKKKTGKISSLLMKIFQ